MEKTEFDLVIQSFRCRKNSYFSVILQVPQSDFREHGLPAERRGRRASKPYLYPAQFEELLAQVPEPYATKVFVAIYTGLRVSELIGLKWSDVHADSIAIDEPFCRCDWGAPKATPATRPSP